MEMWMDVDTALAEVPVNLMPLIDDTDFKTRETAIAYDAAGMDLVWNFVTTAGAFTQTAVTPTTAGNYDWTHQGDGMYTIEIPASGGASINNDTEGFGWFSGFVTGVLPFRGPVIGFRAAALNNALIDGGAVLDVNVTQVSGDGTAADNLEAAADGTGYNLGGGSVVAASVTGAVGSVTGAVGSVTGNVGGNVTGSVGSVATGGITAASIATGAIDADALAADAIAEINATVDAALADYDGPTNAEMEARTIAAASYATATALQTVDDEIATIDTNVDTLLTRITSTLFAGITSLAEWLGLMAGKQTGDATARTELRATGAGSGTFDETADSQEALRDRGDAAWTTATGFSTHNAADVWAVGTRVLTANTNLNDPTAAAIADAVWEEAIADHSGTAGSTAEQLAAAGAAGDPWATALPGAYTSGQAGKIVGDNLNAPVGTVDTVVDAIKAVTDLLPDAGALSSLATASALATVDSNVDAILVDTADMQPKLGTPATDVSADIAAVKTQTAAIEADTQDVQSRLPAALVGGRIDATVDATGMESGAAGVIADAVLDEALAGHVTAGTLGDAIADIDTYAQAILTDTAEIGVAGAGLTEAGGTGDHLTDINLPDQTMNITGDITGNLSGSVGSVTGAVGSVTGNVGGNVTGSIGSLATQAKADVNAEADTAISDAALATAANLATAKTAIDAIKVITDALTAAAAAKLAASSLGIITGTVDTTVAPSTTEFECDDITEATADHYIGRIVTFTSGALAGQSTDITDYSLASGKGHFTVTSLTEPPGNNDTLVIT